ncbi:MAG: glycosyltransferase [Gemmatimonadales bacterium]
MTGRDPDLSVVVPFVNQPADLADCLAALDAARSELELEVLVVDRRGTAGAVVGAGAPWVRVLPASGADSIPEMRFRAFREARGAIVAVIEDHVIVPPTWARAMIDAIEEGRDVVGGGLYNLATSTLADRAAFLGEYAPFLPPADGVRPPGNNVGYRRAVLARYLEVAAEGGWENRLHGALERDGITPVCLAELAAGHKLHLSLWAYTSQRYLFSRSWAGIRHRGAPLAQRIAAGLASMALPPVLLWRMVSTVWRKSGHRRELPRSLPLLAWFATVGAVGEVAGCWFGPGDATRRVQ